MLRCRNLLKTFFLKERRSAVYKDSYCIYIKTTLSYKPFCESIMQKHFNLSKSCPELSGKKEKRCDRKNLLVSRSCFSFTFTSALLLQKPDGNRL